MLLDGMEIAESCMRMKLNCIIFAYRFIDVHFLGAKGKSARCSSLSLISMEGEQLFVMFPKNRQIYMLYYCVLHTISRTSLAGHRFLSVWVSLCTKQIFLMNTLTNGVFSLDANVLHPG